MDPSLIITVSRPKPDGKTEYIAHSSDPMVIEATVAALERALRDPDRRRVLKLAREAEPESQQPDAGGEP
jgi:hypothetical protein